MKIKFIIFTILTFLFLSILQITATAAEPTYYTFSQTESSSEPSSVISDNSSDKLVSNEQLDKLVYNSNLQTLIMLFALALGVSVFVIILLYRFFQRFFYF